MSYVAVKMPHLSGEPYALVDLDPSIPGWSGPTALCQGDNGNVMAALATLLNRNPDALNHILQGRTR